MDDFNYIAVDKKRERLLYVIAVDKNKVVCKANPPGSEEAAKEKAITLKKDETMLLQSTGKRDADNNELYRGDMIKYRIKFRGEEGEFYKNFIGVIDWDYEIAAFTARTDLYGTFAYLHYCKDIEKFGNIYENPSLVGLIGEFDDSPEGKHNVM